MFQDVAFYVLWILFFICIAPLILLNCDTIIGKILGAVLALALTFGVSVAFCHQDTAQTEKWNEGICECGGTYEFTGAAKTSMSTTYYYTCDTCGHTEEFDHIMK